MALATVALAALGGNGSLAYAAPGETSTIAADIVRVVEAPGGGWADADPASAVDPGDFLSYRLSLSNTGSAELFDPAILVTLPSYLTLQSWEAETPPIGWGQSSLGSSLFFGLYSSITPGATASVILTAQLSSDHHSIVELRSCVESSNTTTTGQQLCALSLANIPSTDWELVANRLGSGPAEAGSTVRYQLTAYNNGPDISSAPVTVTAVLPAGFGYAGALSVMVNGATVALPAPVTTVDPATSTTQLSWLVPGPISVAPSAAGVAAVMLSFDALIAADVPAGAQELRATAVEGLCPEDPVDPGCFSSIDPNPANNSDVVGLEVTTARAVAPEVLPATGAGPVTSAVLLALGLLLLGGGLVRHRDAASNARR